MFLRSHTAWSNRDQPKISRGRWTGARLIACWSLCLVAGFLHGENEDEKGRFTVIMGLLKPDLNK